MVILVIGIFVNLLDVTLLNNVKQSVNVNSFCNILCQLEVTNISITSTADSELEDSVVVAEDGSSSGHSSLAERATKSHLVVWQVATA